MKIFTKRKLTYGLLILSVLLLLLVLILLTVLAQLSSINSEVDRLQELIDNAKADSSATAELLEYMESNEYICEWAEANGMISSDDLNWQDK